MCLQTHGIQSTSRQRGLYRDPWRYPQGFEFQERENQLSQQRLPRGDDSIEHDRNFFPLRSKMRCRMCFQEFGAHKSQPMRHTQHQGLLEALSRHGCQFLGLIALVNSLYNPIRLRAFVCGSRTSDYIYFSFASNLRAGSFSGYGKGKLLGLWQLCVSLKASEMFSMDAQVFLRRFRLTLGLNLQKKLRSILAVDGVCVHPTSSDDYLYVILMNIGSTI